MTPRESMLRIAEAMEERQVTVGGRTHELPQLFLVLATRTPDRFDSDLARWIRLEASPRSTLALDAAAR